VSCVLRAGGPSFDVKTFCVETSLSVVAKHETGDRLLPSSKPAQSSGLNVIVSEADFADLGQQIKDAMAFLETNADEVRRLVSFPGVVEVTLDFGLERRDVPAQVDTFPASLVSLAGALGLGITVSQYEIGPDD
jgi:hypothetical protein